MSGGLRSPASRPLPSSSCLLPSFPAGVHVGARALLADLFLCEPMERYFFVRTVAACCSCLLLSLVPCHLACDVRRQLRTTPGDGGPLVYISMVLFLDCCELLGSLVRRSNLFFLISHPSVLAFCLCCAYWLSHRGVRNLGDVVQALRDGTGVLFSVLHLLVHGWCLGWFGSFWRGGAGRICVAGICALVRAGVLWVGALRRRETREERMVRREAEALEEERRVASRVKAAEEGVGPTKAAGEGVPTTKALRKAAKKARKRAAGEVQRKAEEEKERRAAEEEKRKAAEEEEKKAKKKAAEEEGRKAAEEEGRKAAEVKRETKVAAEEKKKVAEEMRTAAEERRKAAEEEKRAAAEKRRKAVEAARRAAEEARRKAEEEEKKEAGSASTCVVG